MGVLVEGPLNNLRKNEMHIQKPLKLYNKRNPVCHDRNYMHVCHIIFCTCIIIIWIIFGGSLNFIISASMDKKFHE